MESATLRGTVTVEETVTTGNKHASLTVFPLLSCQLTPPKPGGQEPAGAASKVRVGRVDLCGNTRRLAHVMGNWFSQPTACKETRNDCC